MRLSRFMRLRVLLLSNWKVEGSANAGPARMILCAVLLLAGSALRAQDGDPCALPTDKEIIKLLDQAATAKDPNDRHANLKS